VSGLDGDFQRYFEALDRARGQDRCFLCRRRPAEVKSFFGFDEDGVPHEAEAYGLEDVVLERTDIMSYVGLRPICAVCQLNFDALCLLGERPLLERILDEMQRERDRLWPPA
jgi:hypothetical protein